MLLLTVRSAGIEPIYSMIIGYSKRDGKLFLGYYSNSLFEHGNTGYDERIEKKIKILEKILDYLSRILEESGNGGRTN